MRSILLAVIYVSILLVSCKEEHPSSCYEFEGLNNYNKIDSLSKSLLCENPEDWSFIGFGAKPCGGPSTYIAFPITIDTTYFFELVDEYNSAASLCNEKMGRISDCMIISQPSGIECQDGKAVLIYR